MDEARKGGYSPNAKAHCQPSVDRPGLRVQQFSGGLDQLNVAGWRDHVVVSEICIGAKLLITKQNLFFAVHIAPELALMACGFSATRPPIHPCIGTGKFMRCLNRPQCLVGVSVFVGAPPS